MSRPPRAILPETEEALIELMAVRPTIQVMIFTLYGGICVDLKADGLPSYPRTCRVRKLVHKKFAYRQYTPALQHEVNQLNEQVRELAKQRGY